jgi:DNA-binding transcriptional LysR family regulator
MKLEGIATFVTVAESGSLSEAARRLRVSRSVVSERLVELERSLGANLLQRSTRKLSLTEDGAAFLARAARIVRDVQEAAADLAERRGQLSGPLRIAAPVTFGRMHLGPALYPFLAKYPDIQLTLELDDRRVDATSDGFDAVIRHGPIGDTYLVSWQLAASRRVLVAAPAGLGIALLPIFIVGGAIKAGTLRVIDVGIEAEQEYIYIAHADGQHPSAKLRALGTWLREAFGDPPYWETECRDYI